MNAYEKIKNKEFCSEIEELNEGINDLSHAEKSLTTLHQVAGTLFEFLEDVESRNLPQTMRKQLTSLSDNTVEVMSGLEEFFDLFSQKQTPNMTVPKAMKSVSNLHLMLNSFSVFAVEIEREGY